MTDRPSDPPSIDQGPGDDIRAEAARLARLAVASGLELRIMGGMAVWLTSPTADRPPYARSYGDIDLAVSARDARAAAALLERAGYVPERLFNKLHGDQRLNFSHPADRWPIDVVVDQVRMSHTIDLRGRLDGTGPTIDLADLLLTKLQIWEVNEKDLGDVVCLLADHPFADGDSGAGAAIDRRRILTLTAADWGLCHTVLRNLASVIDLAERRPPADPACDPLEAGLALRSAIHDEPKSIGWRARARIGERVRWYETPEDVRH
jgi:hypothetical protein